MFVSERLNANYMSTIALKDLHATMSVDARGTSCPGPRIEALKVIGSISPGEIMEVLSADSRTRTEIPKWCKKQGLEYLGTIEENGYFKVYMKKK
jgi:tRNA 2-thiouridine synthesizing protein A